MLAKKQLQELLAEPSLSKTDRLLLILAHDVDNPKKVQDIKALAVELGCPEVSRYHVSAFLSAAKPKAIALPAGWILTVAGKQYIQSRTVSGSGKDEVLFDEIDRQVLSELRKHVPSAAGSYEQALRDLADTKRNSYRGPATDMREALRETLDHFAPDKAVKSMAGYKQEPDISGPTMKQKVRFILKQHGASHQKSDPAEAAVTIVDEIVGSFVRFVYTRSNVSTHTATDRNEVLKLRHYVRVGLIEILGIKA